MLRVTIESQLPGDTEPTVLVYNWDEFSEESAEMLREDAGCDTTPLPGMEDINELTSDEWAVIAESYVDDLKEQIQACVGEQLDARGGGR